MMRMVFACFFKWVQAHGTEAHLHPGALLVPAVILLVIVLVIVPVWDKLVPVERQDLRAHDISVRPRRDAVTAGAVQSLIRLLQGRQSHKGLCMTDNSPFLQACMASKVQGT